MAAPAVSPLLIAKTPQADQVLLPALANRHGPIAGVLGSILGKRR